MVKKFARILIAALLVLSSVCSLSQVSQAYEKEFDVALLEFLGRRGDVDAQVRVAFLHSFGVGVQKDEAKAVFWYRKAAIEGHRRARSELLGMLRAGYGTPKDPRQIYAWLQKSAEEGDIRATAEMEQMVLGGFDPKTASVEPVLPYLEPRRKANLSNNKPAPKGESARAALDPTPTSIPARASCPSVAKLVVNSSGYSGLFLVELRAGNRPGSRRISGGKIGNGQELAFASVCSGTYFFAFGPEDSETISVTRYFEVKVDGSRYTNPVITIYYSRTSGEGQTIQTTSKKDL